MTDLVRLNAYFSSLTDDLEHVQDVLSDIEVIGTLDSDVVWGQEMSIANAQLAIDAAINSIKLAQYVLPEV